MVRAAASNGIQSASPFFELLLFELLSLVEEDDFEDDFFEGVFFESASVFGLGPPEMSKRPRSSSGTCAMCPAGSSSPRR